MNKLHPLLRWMFQGWLLSASMAAVILLCHRFLSWHGAVLGISVAFLARVFMDKGREAKAFQKMAKLLLGKAAGSSPLGKEGMALFLVHLLLSIASLVFLPPMLAAATLFAAIPFSRMATSQLVLMLPYRGKSPLAPSPYNMTEGLLLFAFGVLPMVVLWWFSASSGLALNWSWALFAPCVVLYGFYLFLASRLRGFTYDSLVFVASMVELAFLLAVALS